MRTTLSSVRLEHVLFQNGTRGSTIPANHKHARTSCCATGSVFIFGGVDEGAQMIVIFPGCDIRQWIRKRHR
jgi:hypothetical protein